MSRSNYRDDIEPWDLIRWRGRVTSATRGVRGQKLLRDMAAALDAMPEKALIRDEFVSPQGECCALGAVALARGLPLDDLLKVDPEEAEVVAGTLDIAEVLAREIAYQNDEAFVGSYNGGAWVNSETPEQRWARVRAWIETQITKEPRR
jgi:hypothetical protein